MREQLSTNPGLEAHTLQQLLGHAQLSTTSIYADAMGPEEWQLVERMYKQLCEARVQA